MIYRVQSYGSIKNTDFIRIGVQRGFGAKSVKDQRDDNNNTALIAAAKFSDLRTIEFLVEEKKVDVEEKDKNGENVFTAAARRGDIEMMKYLDNRDGELRNAKNNDGNTAFQVANVTIKKEMESSGLVNDKEMQSSGLVDDDDLVKLENSTNFNSTKFNSTDFSNTTTLTQNLTSFFNKN